MAMAHPAVASARLASVTGSLGWHYRVVMPFCRTARGRSPNRDSPQSGRAGGRHPRRSCQGARLNQVNGFARERAFGGNVLRATLSARGYRQRSTTTTKRPQEEFEHVEQITSRNRIGGGLPTP